MKQIANDNIPLPVCSALLEVIPIRNAKVVMAVATGLLRTVGKLALNGQRVSVESFQNDLLMQRHLGRNNGGMEERENA